MVLLTYKEAADYARLSEATVRRAKSRGELAYVSFGAAIRFTVRDLDRWIESRTVEPSYSPGM